MTHKEMVEKCFGGTIVEVLPSEGVSVEQVLEIVAFDISVAEKSTAHPHSKTTWRFSPVGIIRVMHQNGQISEHQLENYLPEEEDFH